MSRTTIKDILKHAVMLVLCITLTVSAYAESRTMADKLLTVGDTTVRRIMPLPISDSTYVSTDYTEIHFRVNKSALDIDYMDNAYALLHLDRVVDSIGIENISAIEIISQSSPDGSLERNTQLTAQRSKVMKDYMYQVFPDLRDKISLNTITESWENLAMYVAQDPLLEDDTREKILDIIDSDKLSVATKKSRLKNTLGKNPKTGDVYKYLTTYYYPVIRNSGIYILHMIEPDEPEFRKDPERPYVVEKAPTPSDINYEPIMPPLPQEPPKKRPFIAVKTNLLYDAFFKKHMGWAPIYNIEAELYPTENGRWTWLLEYDFPWHSVPSKHQYLQGLNLQFEGRRYFKEASRHTGHYLSAYIGANMYDICFDVKRGHGYQGEGAGLGLGYGYVWPLGSKPDTRWKLELFIKGGFYMSFYDPYTYDGKYYYDWNDDPNLFLRRNMVLRWLGPTGVGASISYDLIYKKDKKKKTDSSIVQ